MFTITNSHSQEISWPNLTLAKGKNEFASRSAVPAELWEKLERFRSLGLVQFEGAAEAGQPDAVNLDSLKLSDLTNMSKPELVKLAESSKTAVARDADKTAYINTLKVRLPDYKPEDAPPAAGSGTSVVDPAQASEHAQRNAAIGSARATRAVDVANKG